MYVFSVPQFTSPPVTPRFRKTHYLYSSRSLAIAEIIDEDGSLSSFRKILEVRHEFFPDVIHSFAESNLRLVKGCKNAKHLKNTVKRSPTRNQIDYSLGVERIQIGPPQVANYDHIWPELRHKFLERLQIAVNPQAWIRGTHHDVPARSKFVEVLSQQGGNGVFIPRNSITPNVGIAHDNNQVFAGLCHCGFYVSVTQGIVSEVTNRIVVLVGIR